MKKQKKSKIELILPAINGLLNLRLKKYNATGFVNCLLRHAPCPDGRIAIQPTHSTAFYGMDSFIQLVNEYGLLYYVDVENNVDGRPAPVLHIYEL